MRHRTDRLLRGSIQALFITILLCFVLPDAGAAARRHAPKKKTTVSTRAKAKPKPKLDKIVAIVKAEVKPPRPLPPFAQLDLWEPRSARDSAADAPSDRTARSIERLCRYYGIAFDFTSPLTASLSPLEWPAVFTGQKPNPRRQRIEIEKLLTQNSLRFQPLITVEPGDLADVIARAIADGAPVLLNAPGAPIVYGFDRRETDPWWLVQWRERREIVYESERMKTLVWWTDDPAANLAWAMTGPDSGSASSKLRPDDNAWLPTVNASVTGNERDGVNPYPLSIRGFRDKLASAASMPELLAPIDSTDPFGLRRARAARDYTVDIIERLTAMAVDTALSRPLRLALYFYHNATQSLDRLDSLLYDASTGNDVLPRSRANWANPGRKDQGAAALMQMLEWEKQASQQVAIALQVQEKGKR